MSWIYIILAGLFEVVGVSGIARISQAGTIINYFIMIAGFTISFLFLALAMESMPMGTAYAVWTGIGTIGSAIVGIVVFHESRSKKRVFFIALVLFSVIGLKLIE